MNSQRQPSFLPPELHDDIFIQAAEDPKTAHSLALVSRRACKLTADARWRVIVITNIDQFLCLWRTLCLAAGDSYAFAISNRVLETYRSVQGYPHGHKLCTGQVVGKLVSPDVLELWSEDCSCKESCRWKVERADPDWASSATAEPISLPSRKPASFTRHLFVDCDEVGWWNPVDGAHCRHKEAEHERTVRTLQDLHRLLEIVLEYMQQCEPHEDASSARGCRASWDPDSVWKAFTNLHHLSVRPSTFNWHSHVLCFRPSLIEDMQPPELTLVCTEPTPLQDFFDYSLRSSKYRPRKLHLIIKQGNTSASDEVRESYLFCLGLMRAGGTWSLRSALQAFGDFISSDADLLPPQDLLAGRQNGVTHLRLDACWENIQPVLDSPTLLAEFLYEACIYRRTQDRAQTQSFLSQSPLTNLPSIWSDPSGEAEFLRSLGAGSFARLHLVWHQEARTAPASLSSTTGSTGSDPSSTIDNAVSDQEGMERIIAELYRQIGWYGHGHRYCEDDLDFQLLGSQAPRNQYREHIITEAMLSLGIPESLLSIRPGWRAPNTVLKLGGVPAAMTRTQRLDLFLDRAMGGNGAW